jgi:integrase
VQDLADRLYADGLDPRTIKNTLDPLRSIYRRAVNRDEVAINPTTGLELPAPRGKRERIASPDEAIMLLEALPEGDRALWATAFYAGLRRGELRALKWSDIDLKGRIIRVERSLDDGQRKRPGEEIEPKSNAGRRRVPIFEELHPELAAHKLRTGRKERDPRVRQDGRRPVRPLDGAPPGAGRLGEGRARADRASRGPAHGSLDDDRRRSRHQLSVDRDGARLGDNHRRPLWAPDAR